jgi:hypothetical protein
VVIRATKIVDWVKWGALAAIGAVVIAIVSTFVVHQDQSERVSVTVSPIGWKLELRGGIHRGDGMATGIYTITVTGKSPARNVYIREACVAPAPLDRTVELRKDREPLGDLPPGTIERRCSWLWPGDSMKDMELVGKLYFDDDEGTHSFSFCYLGDLPMFVPEGRKYPTLALCPGNKQNFID